MGMENERPTLPPGARDESYVQAATAVETAFLEVARLLSCVDVCPTLHVFGGLAMTALQSSDRLTVMDAQAQVLWVLQDMLNAGEARW